jgi:hypothetical protein
MAEKMRGPASAATDTDPERATSISRTHRYHDGKLGAINADVAKLEPAPSCGERQAQARRRDEPVTCAHCQRTVRRKSRQQRFCSLRRRVSAHRARTAVQPIKIRPRHPIAGRNNSVPNPKNRSEPRCPTATSDKKSITGRDRLTWRKDGVRLLLFHGSDQNPLAIVEPDAKYPFLYRIRYPDGHLSDMVNLTRAKDAACWFALRSLNSSPQETPSEGSQARKKAEAVGNIGQSANRAQRPRPGLLAQGRS